MRAASLLGSLPASLLPLVVPAWEYPAIPTLHSAEPVDRRIPEIERVYSSGGDPSRFRFALRFDAYTLAEGAVPREGRHREGLLCPITSLAPRSLASIGPGSTRSPAGWRPVGHRCRALLR